MGAEIILACGQKKARREAGLELSLKRAIRSADEQLQSSVNRLRKLR